MKEVKLTINGKDVPAHEGQTITMCTNEENFLLMKFARAVLGLITLIIVPAYVILRLAGLAQSFGSGSMTNSIKEVANASAIYLTGSNTTENHPIIALEIKKQ